MGEKEYERKHKEDKPVLAICYDFDKTLSPDNMQAQGYLQSIGYDKTDDFWLKSNALAEDNDMDQNLAYMYLMVKLADGRIAINKRKFEDYGAKVKLYPGVEEWFNRIKKYGEDNGVIVEHYIISSGLKEMIEGTSIAKTKSFEKIYASSFYYEDDTRTPLWPAQVVNYTNKTQFLFRIEKGVLDVNDSGVNDYFKPEDIRVPFRNIVYIGDSETDVPCMKLVNSYGGNSIGVFDPNNLDKAGVYKMMRANRIKYFVPADYSENSEMDILLKGIILKTLTESILEEKYFKCKNEVIDYDEKNDKKAQRKAELIVSLENSRNFARTHEIIGELSIITKWNEKEKEKLFEIAINNTQVYYILGDIDIKSFYAKLLKGMKKLSENAEMINILINE